MAARWIAVVVVSVVRKCISVRPSPRSVKVTTDVSRAPAPHERQPLGRDDLAVDGVQRHLAAVGLRDGVQAERPAGPHVQRDRVDRRAPAALAPPGGEALGLRPGAPDRLAGRVVDARDGDLPHRDGTAHGASSPRCSPSRSKLLLPVLAVVVEPRGGLAQGVGAAAARGGAARCARGRRARPARAPSGAWRSPARRPGTARRARSPSPRRRTAARAARAGSGRRGRRRWR